MIDGEDWHWVLGLGIKGTVPMVIVALLEECVVSGLNRGEAALPAFLLINLTPFINLFI